MEGVPVLIVRDGNLLREVLKLERLTLEEVRGAAREQGIADLSDVKIGVLEPDGKFSFVRFDERRSHAAPEHRT